MIQIKEAMAERQRGACREKPRPSKITRGGFGRSWSEALNLHQGSWSGWRALLASPDAGADASAGGPSLEAIREAARDLVYRVGPGPGRAALWPSAGPGRRPPTPPGVPATRQPTHFSRSEASKCAAPKTGS